MNTASRAVNAKAFFIGRTLAQASQPPPVLHALLVACLAQAAGAVATLLRLGPALRASHLLGEMTGCLLEGCHSLGSFRTLSEPVLRYTPQPSLRSLVAASLLGSRSF